MSTQQTTERTRSSLLRGGVGAILVLIGFTAVPFVTFFGSPSLLDIAEVVSAFGESLRDTKGAENVPWLILVAAVVGIVATGADAWRVLAHQARPTMFAGWVVVAGGVVAAVVLIGIWVVLAEVLGADVGDAVESPSSWVILIGALLMFTAASQSSSGDGRRRTFGQGATDDRESEDTDSVRERGSHTSDAAISATPIRRELEVRALVAVALSAVMVVLLIVGAFAEGDAVVVILALSPFVILVGRHSRLYRRLSEQMPESVRWTLGMDPGAASAVATAVNGIVWLVAFGLWWTALMWLVLSALCVLAHVLADFDRLASRLPEDVTITVGDREYRFSTISTAKTATLVAAAIATIVFLAREDVWWIG